MSSAYIVRFFFIEKGFNFITVSKLINDVNACIYIYIVSLDIRILKYVFNSDSRHDGGNPYLYSVIDYRFHIVSLLFYCLRHYILLRSNKRSSI